MQSIAASRGPALCRAAAAPRRPAPTLRAATRPSIRTRSLASDVGKYLSEAASQIFSPQTDNVPWEQSSQGFSGKIVHHEEAARLKALKEVLASELKQIESSMDEAPADDSGVAAAGEESKAGDFVMTSIQRVFGNNFKGDATEPKEWSSTGYQASGRHRSQRSLRSEYERLQRFQKVVEKVAEKAEKAKVDA
ncbi:hypothetical protein ACK3TF_002825 [Chlorella vulgaris]